MQQPETDAQDPCDPTLPPWPTFYSTHPQILNGGFVRSSPNASAVPLPDTPLLSRQTSNNSFSMISQTCPSVPTPSRPSLVESSRSAARNLLNSTACPSSSSSVIQDAWSRSSSCPSASNIPPPDAGSSSTLNWSTEAQVGAGRALSPPRRRRTPVLVSAPRISWIYYFYPRSPAVYPPSRVSSHATHRTTARSTCRQPSSERCPTLNSRVSLHSTASEPSYTTADDYLDDTTTAATAATASLPVANSMCHPRHHASYSFSPLTTMTENSREDAGSIMSAEVVQMRRVSHSERAEYLVHATGALDSTTEQRNSEDVCGRRSLLDETEAAEKKNKNENGNIGCEAALAPEKHEKHEKQIKEKKRGWKAAKTSVLRALCCERK